jgi:hypothetical protein
MQKAESRNENKHDVNADRPDDAVRVHELQLLAGHANINDAALQDR